MCRRTSGPRPRKTSEKRTPSPTETRAATAPAREPRWRTFLRRLFRLSARAPPAPPPHTLGRKPSYPAPPPSCPSPPPPPYEDTQGTPTRLWTRAARLQADAVRLRAAAAVLRAAAASAERSAREDVNAARWGIAEDRGAWEAVKRRVLQAEEEGGDADGDEDGEGEGGGEERARDGRERRRQRRRAKRRRTWAMEVVRETDARAERRRRRAGGVWSVQWQEGTLVRLA